MHFFLTSDQMQMPKLTISKFGMKDLSTKQGSVSICDPVAAKCVACRFNNDMIGL